MSESFLPEDNQYFKYIFNALYNGPDWAKEYEARPREASGPIEGLNDFKKRRALEMMREMMDSTWQNHFRGGDVSSEQLLAKIYRDAALSGYQKKYEKTDPSQQKGIPARPTLFPDNPYLPRRTPAGPATRANVYKYTF